MCDLLKKSGVLRNLFASIRILHVNLKDELA